MVTKIWDFLSTEGFHPHGMCLLWRPDIFWMHVASDVIIALSYFSIPAALFYLASRRPDLIYRRVFVLFGAFIVACGITHLLSIWTLWVPDYSISALVKTITAIISLTTAIVIWPLMPKLLTLPSTQLLEQKNLELAKEIEERKLAEERLSLSNKLLIHETNRRVYPLWIRTEIPATLSGSAAMSSGAIVVASIRMKEGSDVRGIRNRQKRKPRRIGVGSLSAGHIHEPTCCYMGATGAADSVFRTSSARAPIPLQSSGCAHGGRCHRTPQNPRKGAAFRLGGWIARRRDFWRRCLKTEKRHPRRRAGSRIPQPLVLVEGRQPDKRLGAGCALVASSYRR